MRRIYLAILGLIMLAAPAVASDGKQAAARALEAAQTLQRDAAQAVAAGKRLDIKAAATSEQLRRVFDTKSFAELPAIAPADMPWIIDWLDAVRSAQFTLLYFGADPKRPVQLDQSALARNVKDYEDEIAIAITFMQRLFPRALETAHEFMETLPEEQRKSEVRLDGMVKMIDGYLENIKGALGFAADSATKPANARMIAAAVRNASDLWIELADADARKEFVQLAAAAQQATGDKETAAHFRAIGAALKAAKS